MFKFLKRKKNYYFTISLKYLRIGTTLRSTALMNSLLSPVPALSAYCVRTVFLLSQLNLSRDRSSSIDLICYLIKSRSIRQDGNQSGGL